MSSPPPLGVVVIVAMTCAAGCNRDEAYARTHLASEGLEQIEIRRHASGDGSFAYDANLAGDRCVGRIAVSRSRTRTTIDDRMSCRPLDAQCTDSTPNTCFRLATLHALGDDGVLDPTPPDAALAAHYYERACRGGHGPACNLLGLDYADGSGVGRDLGRAASLFEQSCAAGHGRGCHNLALSLHHGRGVEVDLERAVELYAAACDDGVAAACYNLGVCHRDAIGTPPSPAEAAGAFERACTAGQLQGCVNLGVMLTLGQGVAEDRPRAERLFDRACREGLDTGCRGLEQLRAPGG